MIAVVVERNALRDRLADHGERFVWAVSEPVVGSLAAIAAMEAQVPDNTAAHVIDARRRRECRILST